MGHSIQVVLRENQFPNTVLRIFKSCLQKQPSRGVLRKFTGEHLCRSAISIKLFCNKVAIKLLCDFNKVDFAPASSKKFLDMQTTIECRFTLERGT